MSPSKNELIQSARRMVDEHQLALSQNKIVRLVLRFMDSAPNASAEVFSRYFAAAVQLPANADYSRVVTYRDPTGEQAVNRVLRQRKQ